MENVSPLACPNAAIITLKSVFDHARSEADRLEATLSPSDTPVFDRACMHASIAFELVAQFVFSADDRQILKLTDLAQLFAFLHEHFVRTETLINANAFKVWHGMPGQKFGQHYAASAREVMWMVTQSIHGTLQSSFGYVTVRRQFAPSVLDLRISGEINNPELEKWPQRAFDALRVALPPANRWERLSDGKALLSAFAHEQARSHEFIAHLQSLDWYTLAVFGCRAVTNWDEEPEYREQVRDLASQMRTAAIDQELIAYGRSQELVYQAVLDWLVARTGCTVASANALSVKEIVHRLRHFKAKPNVEGAKAITPKLPPKNLTPTERRVFPVIRAAGRPIVAAAIASATGLREDSVYRACGFLVRRGFLKNDGDGYIALMDSLPT